MSVHRLNLPAPQPESAVTQRQNGLFYTTSVWLYVCWGMTRAFPPWLSKPDCRPRRPFLRDICSGFDESSSIVRHCLGATPGHTHVAQSLTQIPSRLSISDRGKDVPSLNLACCAQRCYCLADPQTFQSMSVRKEFLESTRYERLSTHHVA